MKPVYRLRVMQLESTPFLEDEFNYAYELKKNGEIISKDLFIDVGQGMETATQQAKEIIFNTTGIKLE